MGSPKMSSCNKEKLHLAVVDLFTAGMVTTLTMLAWALLVLLYTDVQHEPSRGWMRG